MRLPSLLITVLLIGCSGEDETAPITAPGDCAPGEWRRDDGVCLAAGLPADMPCPPAEWMRDGVCIPAGVPPDGCAPGFMHDGDRGCEPILPSAPCGPGLMAVPGEATCREVAPCAAGKWGDIPVEADTEYVDASYSAMDSDGSALKPWTTIQAAIAAAAPDAIIAIAEGSYPEDIVVVGKNLRLWGVCPALVEVVGTGAEAAAVQLVGGVATAAEVRRLAIRGSANGVFVGALNVLLEQVWVHDTGGRGIEVAKSIGFSTTLRGSLVEHTRELGVFVIGADATIEASIVRATQTNAQGQGGPGVGARLDPFISTSCTLTLRGSIVEQSHTLGVYVLGSEVTLEGSVVRDTQPDPQGAFGRGVNAQPEPSNGAPSTLRLDRSFVALNYDIGVLVEGSQATVEASVIRNTQPNAQGLGGRGVGVQRDEMLGAPSTLELRTSLIEQNHELGVIVVGSQATVEASVLRDIQLNAQGIGGTAISVQHDPISGASSTVSLVTSLLERNREIGMLSIGSVVTMEASVVRDTQANALGIMGRGVGIQPNAATAAPSTFELRSSLVEKSNETGVFISSSTATIESSVVRETVAYADGRFGDGVIVWSAIGAANATVTATQIDRSARTALGAHGAQVAVGGSAFTCQLLDLDREPYQGKPATLEDLGGNLCGCPEATQTCTPVSAKLEPPPPI